MKTWIVLLLAAALVLSGCSGSPDVPELTGVRAVSVQAMKVSTMPPDGLDFHAQNEDRGMLGPHFRLALAWTATGTQIDPSWTERTGVDAVRAPDGQQLVVAAISPKTDKLPFPPTADAPRADFVVGNTVKPVSGLPLPQSEYGFASQTYVLMAAAAPGTPVKLRITDEGVSQEIDLRTGAVTGRGYQQRDAKMSWGDTPLSCGAGVLRVMDPLSTSRPDAVGQAYLTNYQGGWAPPGKAFLTVLQPALASGSVGLLGNTVKFDAATTFTFTPDGGAPIPAAAGAGSILIIPADPVDTPATVVFTVPEAAAKGTITMDLAHATLTDDGRTTPWHNPPKPLSIPVTFS